MNGVRLVTRYEHSKEELVSELVCFDSGCNWIQEVDRGVSFLRARVEDLAKTVAEHRGKEHSD